MHLRSILSFAAVLGAFPVLGTSAPLDSSDIICHGKDCYPRIFQATNEFQVVREDQSIPKGLHVRMDINTGVKEAKLYDGVDDPNLQAVEVFAETDVAEPIPSPAEGLDFLHSGAQQVLKPKEADHGAIRPPPSGPDGVGFSRDTAILTSGSSSDEQRLTALENLEDLSHDIYWGLRLSQDGKVIHKLNTFIGSSSLNQQLRSAAALLLGTAIQNNPAALTAALSHFYNDQYPEGPLETVMFALLHEQIPALTVRLVYLLSELCQDQAQLLKFIRADGLAVLRELFDAHNANNDAKDRLRQKISNFVLDHFLMEESLQEMTRAAVPVHKKDSEKATIVDDSWIIIDKADASTSEDAESPLNARASLSKWCEPFSTSLKAWQTGNGKGESGTAQEHVQEAATALDTKLRSYGCSCKNMAACQ